MNHTDQITPEALKRFGFKCDEEHRLSGTVRDHWTLGPLVITDMMSIRYNGVFIPEPFRPRNIEELRNLLHRCGLLPTGGE